MLPTPHPRLPIKYAVSPTADSPRERAITEAVALISNLLRCVVWLVKQGVYVVGFRGYRENGVDHVVVNVAPTPLLHRLFGEDCAWRARRQEGALTIYTWMAERFGIRIEWEEVTCA